MPLRLLDVTVRRLLRRVPGGRGTTAGFLEKDTLEVGP